MDTFNYLVFAETNPEEPEGEVLPVEPRVVGGVVKAEQEVPRVVSRLEDWLESQGEKFSVNQRTNKCVKLLREDSEDVWVKAVRTREEVTRG